LQSLRLGFSLGHHDDAPGLARGVFLSAPPAPPKFTCGCSSNRGQEDKHSPHPWCNQKGNHSYFYSSANPVCQCYAQFLIIESNMGKKLLHRCSEFKQSMSTTLFVFLSPQFLINHPNVLDVFITCAQEQTLRLIAIDEVHIHVQHGLSFREEICALHVKFFRLIYGNQPSNQHPRLIAQMCMARGEFI
jgi:hypothetical protein